MWGKIQETHPVKHLWHFWTSHGTYGGPLWYKQQIKWGQKRPNRISERHILSSGSDSEINQPRRWKIEQRPMTWRQQVPTMRGTNEICYCKFLWSEHVWITEGVPPDFGIQRIINKLWFDEFYLTRWFDDWGAYLKILLYLGALPNYQ